MGTVDATHVYADNGTYTVTVVVTDGDGAATTSTFTVTVNNVASTVVAGPDQTVNQGDLVSLAPSSFNDLGTADTHTPTVTWSDGTTTESATVTESPFGPPGATTGANGTVAASHIYVDNGAYTVTVTVTDDDGDAISSTLTVVVHNVAPTVDAGADGAIFSGQSHTVTATFTDPSIVDTHTSTIDWGDGSPLEAVTVVQGPGSGSLTANHRYLAPEVYTVTACVTDDDGGKTCDQLLVTVTELLVMMNIRPGQGPNVVNLNAHVDLAIFSTSKGEFGLPEPFDATEINVSTVRFGPLSVLIAGGGASISGKTKIKNATAYEVKRKDSDRDMELRFTASESGMTSSSTSACVRGITTGGVYFQGCDSVQIVPDGAPPKKN